MTDNELNEEDVVFGVRLGDATEDDLKRFEMAKRLQALAFDETTALMQMVSGEFVEINEIIESVLRVSLLLPRAMLAQSAAYERRPIEAVR